MNNSSRFILSGIISISFYIFICFIIYYFLVSPKTKKFTTQIKTTTIELDMIVEKSDVKRIEKKAEKKRIEPEVVVKRAASVSNKSRPNVKSLFGKVKTKVKKVEKKKINNVVASIDPKRFKSKFQKEKKSSNVKLDRLKNDKKTTTNIRSTNKSKSKENSTYFSSVQSLLDVWEPSSRAEGLKAKVRIFITPSGGFSYNFLSYSGDTNFDYSLKSFLDNQKNISYPKPTKGKKVTIDVDFKSKG